MIKVGNIAYGKFFKRKILNEIKSEQKHIFLAHFDHSFKNNINASTFK